MTGEDPLGRRPQRKVADAGFALARASPGSNQVDDREEHDPHEVDEVPVEADRLDPLVARLRVLPEEGLPRDEGHADDAAEDVEAVEARRREEDRAEEADVRVEVLVEELPVLDGLDREEDRAEEKRQAKEELQLADVAAADGGQGLDHRHRRADQDERVHGRQGDVQDRGRGAARAASRTAARCRTRSAR